MSHNRGSQKNIRRRNPLRLRKNVGWKRRRQFLGTCQMSIEQRRIKRQKELRRPFLARLGLLENAEDGSNNLRVPVFRGLLERRVEVGPRRVEEIGRERDQALRRRKVAVFGGLQKLLVDFVLRAFGWKKGVHSVSIPVTGVWPENRRWKGLGPRDRPLSRAMERGSAAPRSAARLAASLRPAAPPPNTREK